jgi:DNA polymerase III subunit beta
MKLSIERATLLKALAQAQSVVERRNTIPILANVLIEAEGAQVSFRATDLDIEVVDRAAAMVERAGCHDGFGGHAARNRAEACPMAHWST